MKTFFGPRFRSAVGAGLLTEVRVRADVLASPPKERWIGQRAYRSRSFSGSRPIAGAVKTRSPSGVLVRFAAPPPVGNLASELISFSYLVDPASFGTLNLELKPCILLTAYPATGRAISVHGSVDRWDERAVLHFKVITTETLWLIPFPTPRASCAWKPRRSVPSVRPAASRGRVPTGVGSFAGGEHEVTNLSNHCQPVRLIIV